MKANSDKHPGQFTTTQGKWFCNYNIVKSTKTDEMTGETRTGYDYDVAEITGDPSKDDKIAWDESKVDAFIDAMDKAAKERPTLKCDVDISRLTSPSDAARKKAEAIEAERGWKIKCAAKPMDPNEVVDENAVDPNEVQ